MRQHRPAPVTLAPGIVLTDQRPMPPAALRRCLVDDWTPDRWYALLNAKVFFWLDAGRLNRQRRAGGAPAQIVMILDVERLLERHADRAAVAPINTGAAMRRPARRGPSSFVPYATWRATGWAIEAGALGTLPRPRSHRPAELTIDDAVPDVLDSMIEVRHLAPGDAFVP